MEENLKIAKALEEFDYEQYKKDITELNNLTSRILKSENSCVSKSWVDPDGTRRKEKASYPREKYMNGNGMSHIKEKTENLDKKSDGMYNFINNFGNSYVGRDLYDDITEISKEKTEDKMPPLAKDLKDLQMYGVYTVGENKFDVTYLDIVMEEDVKKEIYVDPDINNQREKSKIPFMQSIVDSVSDIQKQIDLNESNTYSMKMFKSTGKMKDRLIPLSNTRIEIGIKDFINDDFIGFVKNLAEMNIDPFTKKMKLPMDINDNDVKILSRINMISNYIHTKNKMGRATFIYSSKKNIEKIKTAFDGVWLKDGKTYKYNKTTTNNGYSLLANDDLGDTVIIGKLPKEGEVGINLVINEKTFTNFEYSEDDISGVNLSFGFYAFGQHPEWNYFSFEMK